MADKPASKWAATGHTVRGASHVRTGLPNQDAIAYSVETDGGASVVLAVSDGHGSVKSCRSATGSQVAVKIAVEITLRFLAGMRSSSVSAIKAAAERLLTADLVKRWQQIVSLHLEKNPFTAEELDRLEREAGATTREMIQKEGRGLLAYGATLLLVAIGDGFLFYLQLGDGDILAVSDKTRQVEHPMPEDAALIANETTSLCLEGAQKMFRFKFQYIQDVPPALILVSTDGYSNSFATPGDFNKVGTDLLEMIRSRGLTYVQNGLQEWLEDASLNGSGDDVTLGIVCRSDAIGPVQADVMLEAVPVTAAEPGAATPITDPIQGAEK